MSSTSKDFTSFNTSNQTATTQDPTSTISGGDLFAPEVASTKDQLEKRDQVEQSDQLKPESSDSVKQQQKTSTEVSPSIKPLTSRYFFQNEAVVQFLAINNFPPPYPTRVAKIIPATDADKPAESEQVVGETSVTDTEIVNKNIEITNVTATLSPLTRNYTRFWNKLIKKQNPTQTTHELTEYEAGYINFTITDAIKLINSDILKSYCAKGRYENNGCEFFPTKNQFSKIQQRSLAKLEASKLLEYYKNEANQFIIIPFEFTSSMSRSFLCSYEMSQQTQACNKIRIPINFSVSMEDMNHPISAIGYKDSIEQEILPASSICLVDNFTKLSQLIPDNLFRNKNIQNTLFNYPYISHIFNRSDFWVDDLYVKLWHYARRFCDKIDFKNRVGSTNVLLIKDTVFRHLLHCSVEICSAVKVWVLDEDLSTYFRCWCGQKAYNTKSETQLINRSGIGSSKMMSSQMNVLNKLLYHAKHEKISLRFHMCQCGKEFQNHKDWFQHTFSTKIYDLTKSCPIVLYNFINLSLLSENNKYQCECNAEFGDYDFWQFWLHLCACKTMRKVVSTSCPCCNKYKGASLKRPSSKNSQIKKNKKRKLNTNQTVDNDANGNTDV